MNRNYLECNKCWEKISGRDTIISRSKRIKEVPFITYWNCEFCGWKFNLLWYARTCNTNLEKAKELNCKECIELASNDWYGWKITCDIHWDWWSLENWNA